MISVPLPVQPSRPGYPSPRSSEGFYPSPQHAGQLNHYQVGYPGPHGMPAMPSGGYPPQAGVLDPHETWNHHRPGDVPMWSPNMEVRVRAPHKYTCRLFLLCVSANCITGEFLNFIS
uniref:Uncharacterized protein n=1 Tax=Hucho hucho TaxID=62062 RepID=A0A4W5PJD5_9TELE